MVCVVGWEVWRRRKRSETPMKLRILLPLFLEKRKPILEDHLQVTIGVLIILPVGDVFIRNYQGN
jgi:hypothetical protein